MPMCSKGFVLVLLTVYLSLLAASDLDEQVPVVVNRRIAFDTYRCFNTSGIMICPSDTNTTYLVSERRCVKDQELFSGKVERGVVDTCPPFCKTLQT